jgi:LacI family transcriptional regulator
VTTISDVARLTGLSRATVSRALAGASGVSALTRARVNDASAMLGYRPNRIAQSLRQRTTGMVGMVVPNLNNPFFPAVVKGVEEALHDSGMGLLLCDAGEDVHTEMQRILALLDRRVDGLLISPVDSLDSVRALQQAAAASVVVQVDRRVAVPTDSVTVDQERGMSALLRYLVEVEQRRTFAFVTSAERISTGAERLAAYRRSMADVDPPSSERVLAGDFSVQWGLHAGARLAEAGRLPDAIVCANDLIAAGVLQSLRARGVRVPSEVAVSGYDDTFLAVVTDPPLTSVRQPLDQLGREAVAMLRAGIASPGVARRELCLAPQLVVRESTGHRLQPGVYGVAALDPGRLELLG